MINLRSIKDLKSKTIEKEKQAEEDTVVESIPIHLIRPNPYQPRKIFTEQSLNELCQSIKEYGLLQPINVRRVGRDSYELIVGERRLRAAKMAGFTHIPAIVIDAYEQDSAIIALIENLQREDLFYLEEAEGYYNLIKDHGFTQEELARKLGKSQSTVANKLRLLRLPVRVKNLLMETNLTERHARALLRLHDEETQIKVIKQVVLHNYNVKKTEELVEKILQRVYERQNKNEPGKKGITVIYRDYRLFINTMRNAVKSMREAGLSAQFFQEDKGDAVEIRVVIPKTN
ncbi:MAG: nucleoid occlusion protein [Clostridia bacterium]|jgi:ParB family chromosome partitioning protein